MMPDVLFVRCLGYAAVFVGTAYLTRSVGASLIVGGLLLLSFARHHDRHWPHP